jgi:hypothetical protein
VGAGVDHLGLDVGVEMRKRKLKLRNAIRIGIEKMRCVA